jgi:hypothetical protein
MLSVYENDLIFIILENKEKELNKQDFYKICSDLKQHASKIVLIFMNILKMYLH